MHYFQNKAMEILHLNENTWKLLHNSGITFNLRLAYKDWTGISHFEYILTDEEITASYLNVKS